MRCLVLIAVVITGTVARPETYKEKEDFQFSRSSSDDGSKAGYYGAQRGNMGGNYERAHNMDSLAQHQMSGLVHQVEGEIGDTSNTNAGSVFTAANSRGMYGSGHYDLSNLEGRNFQEGTSLGDSHSQSALTNSAYRNRASGINSYGNSNSYSHNSKYSSSDHSEREQREEIQSSNLKSGESTYQQEYGAYEGSSKQGSSWSPYQNRLVSTRPMRILVRPGTRVTVPVATQTYDADHSASSYDASAYNQNAATSDAEVIINNDHETRNRHVPTSKNYESSYSYRKEWEKHHSSPGAVPLGVDIDSSIPKTSELYDDSQHTQTYNNQHQYALNAADSHSHQSSNLYGYNSKSNLASSSQSKHQSDYDVQRERLSSDLNALTLNTQQSNLNQDYENQQGLVNSKPKSYQSSYSYHKSWERQGDPYVIVPVPDVQNGQASQRLSTASNSHSGYSSHQYGSNRKQSHQSYTGSNGLTDCDEQGHIRVARSYNIDQEVQQQQNGWDELGQQSQNLWDGQTQNQWTELEELGQQSQNQWDKIEDLGQQTQTHFDKIEDLGQQSQNQWDKIEDLGQQTQNHFNKIEDLGQQSQNQWDKIQDLGQQTQFDKIEDLGQQSQNPWDKIEDLGQQTQTHFDKIEDLGQQSQNQWDKIEDLDQHSQNQWNKYNQFDQQSQSNFGQEQATWNKLDQSKEDKHIHEIYKDQSYSKTFANDVKHYYTDKQTDTGHKKQTEEQQNNFYTHIPNDFHKQHTEESLSDSRIHHTSPVNSLWDKLDRLSGESRFNNNQNTNEYTSFIENKHKSNLSKASTTRENVVVTEKTVAKDLGRGDVPDTIVLQPKNNGRGDIPDTPESLEFLKHLSTTEKTKMIPTTVSIFKDRNETKYGALQDIEALSLTANNNEIIEKSKRNSDEFNRDSKMENINQQSEHSSNSYYVNHDSQGKQVLEEKDLQSTNHLSESFENERDAKQNMHITQELQQFEKPSESFDQQNINQNFEDFSTLNENFDQQSMSHKNEGFDLQNENLEHQNIGQELQSFDKPVEIEDLHKSEQNLVDFSNWNKDMDQHSFSHPPQSFDQQNQQNVDQEIHNFEKPMEILDQQNLEQNLEQNLVDFSKWNENLDKQRMTYNQQGFDQQNQQNLKQDIHRFVKPGNSFDQQNSNRDLVDSQFSENAHQPSTHLYSETFHQHSENLNQQNMEQELQSFDKISDSFDQQNLNENFDQQNMNQYGYNPESEISEQELQNFDRPSESFDQQNLNQNLVDFSKLNENFDQQRTSHHLEKSDNQNENLEEQQNIGQKLQNFEKPVEILDQQNLNQNKDDFSQFNEKFDQQNTNQDSKEFRKPVNSFYEQQHLNKNNLQHQSNNQQLDFGTGRENYDQQSIHQSFRRPASEIVEKPVSATKLDYLQQNNKLLSTQQTELHEVSQPMIPPETEQTGFWASVGKKFTSAKDKVSSWFRKKSD